MRVFSLCAIITAFMYLILHIVYLKDTTPGTKQTRSTHVEGVKPLI